MSVITNTTEGTFYFILTDIPGFEAVHIWISIPFFCLYMISMIGNTTILTVIWMESSRHQPMYMFLSMLTLTDLGLTLTTLPTVMCLLWFNAYKISLEACFIQFFFLHCFSFMESSVLLAMAFDRYVVICRPLRYASILTDSCQQDWDGRHSPLCGGSHASSLPAQAAALLSLPCTHSYCLHQNMIRLVCGDITINSWYGFGLVMVIYVLDPLHIVFSYALILCSVLHAASQAERLRAFINYLSHILAVLVLYVPMIGLSMVHHFAQHASPLVHVVMANIYLLSPPVMNSIIYTVKTKQIHQYILHLLSQRKVYKE